MEDFKKNGQAQQIINYIKAEIVRDPGVEITEETPLVSSGLIDSLALVNVLRELEDLTQLRIPAGKVQPKDMNSVSLMMATAHRVGRPRK